MKKLSFLFRKFSIVNYATVLILLLFAAPPSHAAPYFTTLGFLPGYDTESRGASVSADGSTVVGYSSSADANQAFRWTEGGGLQGLGFRESNHVTSRAYDVSANGSVIVGSSGRGPGIAPVAFRWTSAGGMQALTGAPSGGRATVISNDGLIVGGSDPAAYRWTLDGGLEYLNGRNGFDEVRSISGDGATIGGSTDDFFRQSAFIWTEEGGYIAPNLLPPASDVSRGSVDAISSTGSFAAGSLLFEQPFGEPGSPYFKTYLWSTEGPTEELFRSSSSVSVTGISGDGSIVVGHFGTTGSPRGPWLRQNDGARSLGDYFANNGLVIDYDGFRLLTIEGISDDGLVLTGSGVKNGRVEAWVAVIPEPGSGILLSSGLAAMTAARRSRYRR